MASSGSEPAGDRRPRIGLTTYLEPARYGVWSQEAALLPRAYVEVVARVGGWPVLLPPVADLDASVVGALDGLVLSGGGDVDPARYGASPHPRTGGTSAQRDAAEEGLLRGALARDVPVLGVCRGMQVLNVVLGGTLAQHLPDVVGHEGHRPAPAEFGRTRVSLAADSVVGGLLGDEVEVACYHHQAVDVLSDDLVAVGRADDGTVEAVELRGPRFAVGVQWHPEVDGDDCRLFAALVDATREGTT
ncbi:gamma-glutamyl-gamma-aminobutyrate hydrolase family protein [Geodermatophilus sp. YIM 151500]|uniref:gamma-glutamyl-gamma-aminobutyrate hydrolase family protein n=1 Tax=Geodermatophilus sp. YIM 151500 TaxID=2984531 RepID=UPI0021E422FB|nr:gamma-glutamyl-gamma-aminobutyrate hydrolase family protein [Geodermatophilus sp. YIM 151500]MCV2488257.1 gamma-glutamyl-gamma-aminobutyrate hydrolase family protein [Geodermatophilus sp. YIM 151500]